MGLHRLGKCREPFLEHTRKISWYFCHHAEIFCGTFHSLSVRRQKTLKRPVPRMLCLVASHPESSLEPNHLCTDLPSYFTCATAQVAISSEPCPLISIERYLSLSSLVWCKLSCQVSSLLHAPQHCLWPRWKCTMRLRFVKTTPWKKGAWTTSSPTPSEPSPVPVRHTRPPYANRAILRGPCPLQHTFIGSIDPWSSFDGSTPTKTCGDEGSGPPGRPFPPRLGPKSTETCAQSALRTRFGGPSRRLFA